MDEAWQILRDGGLPLAMPRTPRRPSAEELAHAALAAIASRPDGRDAEALAAFLLAWRHHWPTAFGLAFARTCDPASRTAPRPSACEGGPSSTRPTRTAT